MKKKLYDLLKNPHRLMLQTLHKSEPIASSRIFYFVISISKSSPLRLFFLIPRCGAGGILNESMGLRRRLLTAFYSFSVD